MLKAGIISHILTSLWNRTELYLSLDMERTTVFV